MLVILKNQAGGWVKTKKGTIARTFCDPAGTRTQDPYIKSVLLYQLSYGIAIKAGAKIGIFLFHPNF